jgi:hypothetical protein
MQRRNRLDVCLPAALFIVLCVTSLPGLVIALSWMTVGMMAIGHRGLESFPQVAPAVDWRSGYRSGCVWFYHIAWWPWYVRHEMYRVVRRFLGTGRVLSERLATIDLREPPPSVSALLASKPDKENQ